MLWFWIKDAATGPTGVRSAVMIALWDTFEREGVKLPKPGPAQVIVEQPKYAGACRSNRRRLLDLHALS